MTLRKQGEEGKKEKKGGEGRETHKNNFFLESRGKKIWVGDLWALGGVDTGYGQG